MHRMDETPAQKSPSPLPEMKYHQLGRTSLRVSIVGFGASPLGNVFGDPDPVECTAAVHCAIERGINFFDVSPYYGLTLAEKRLGQALRGHRDKVVLATKCGRYGDDHFDFSPGVIAAGVEDSLRRLQTDHVDLLQAHDVEFEEVDRIVEDTIPAMRRLQQQGKTRYIGITGYSLANLIHIAQRVDVDSILTYCRYNLMVGDMDDVLVSFAKQQGIGIINASALHMAVFTERGAPCWHPAPREVHEAGRRVVDLCRRHHIDVSELAVRYCVQHPEVATTLVGMSSRKHVEASLRALTPGEDSELMREIRSIIAPVYNRTWASGRQENYG